MFITGHRINTMKYLILIDKSHERHKNTIWAEVPLISKVHFLKEIVTELQISLLSLYFGFLMSHYTYSWYIDEA